MELRQFVSQALLDIIGGVEDAQSKTAGGIIVPPGASTKMTVVESGYTHIQIVDFEVSVRADERSSSEGKLSVVAVVFGAGIKGTNDKQDERSAILKFKIPLKLPTGKAG
jgi:hypothetical protein